MQVDHVSCGLPLTARGLFWAPPQLACLAADVMLVSYKACVRSVSVCMSSCFAQQVDWSNSFALAEEMSKICPRDRSQGLCHVSAAAVLLVSTDLFGRRLTCHLISATVSVFLLNLVVDRTKMQVDLCKHSNMATTQPFVDVFLST
jgi:hypothetical protein